MNNPTQPKLIDWQVPEPLRPAVVPPALHAWNTAEQQERVRRARAEREAREAAQALREHIRRNEAERGRG